MKAQELIDKLLPYEADNYDWQAFRREAAKDILCAMVSGWYNWSRVKEHTELAVKYADKLIEQLRDDTED